MFKTIKENASAEIVEKKSKFIANIFYVETREEAEGIIKNMNKKYHDARHNCYAYRIYNESGIIEKSSDDGEPSGTAGAPILNILAKGNIVNVLVIVTRYFGGILLGTGGLVKAYSEACNKALQISKIINIESGYLYKIILQYKEIGRFKHFCDLNTINITKESYLENIELNVELTNEKIKLIEKCNNIEFETIKIEKIKNVFIYKA